jgi:hypothetical protein
MAVSKACIEIFLLIFLKGLIIIFSTNPIGLTFSQRILTYFLYHSKSMGFVSLCLYYVSEMIVCHAIYQSVMNEIWKRTVTFILERAYF